MPQSVLDRLLRYAAVDTQSNPRSPKSPSTEGQWRLLRMLEGELRELGAADVTLTANGYLTATIPATSRKPGIPAVGLLAHVDTSPDFCGSGVKPLVHPSYRGEPIVLPDDPSQVLDPSDPHHEELQTAVGKDVVTASGKTLLGADDKAGVAVLMALAEHLLGGPGVSHGKVRVCFTPDEEIGRGVDGLDLDALGANAAYTLDGEGLGAVNWETFSAREAVVSIQGVATHPGTARKHGMVNAIHLAAKLLAALPREQMSPEATEGREGFLHPTGIEGNAATTTVRLILRDHDEEALAAKGRLLRSLCSALGAGYPGAAIRCRIKDQYRNMGIWLRDQMAVVDLAREACEAAGVTPLSPPIRGGTDGARLTERGLPTPNLFCGARNPHGPLEWVAREDMEAALAVLVKLIELWEEKGAGFEGYAPGR